mmetsp:Transcript_19707/g.40654  ORF Transcript_19707/g.40654 Transcript_19707/m.40654 type:complete len:206 (+) Transcript_19707:110-727(+)
MNAFRFDGYGRKGFGENGRIESNRIEFHRERTRKTGFIVPGWWFMPKPKQSPTRRPTPGRKPPSPQKTTTTLLPPRLRSQASIRFRCLVPRQRHSCRWRACRPIPCRLPSRTCRGRCRHRWRCGHPPRRSSNRDRPRLPAARWDGSRCRRRPPFFAAGIPIPPTPPPCRQEHDGSGPQRRCPGARGPWAPAPRRGRSWRVTTARS